MTADLSQRSAKLRALQDLFSATHDTEDLLAILDEADGDLDLTIARIAEGTSLLMLCHVYIYISISMGCIYVAYPWSTG
jgi:hypothetical protein